MDQMKAMGYDGVEVPVFNTDLDYAAWGKRLDDLGLERTAVTENGLAVALVRHRLQIFVPDLEVEVAEPDRALDVRLARPGEVLQVRLVGAAIAMLVETRAASGDEWSWREGHIDRLAGTDAVRLLVESGAGVDEVTSSWRASLTAFEELREPYLLYD